MTSNWINQLGQRTLNDDYFKELFFKAEVLLIDDFNPTQTIGSFNEKELTDLLRFADILSNTNNDNARNIAYKIISLLYEPYKNLPEFHFFAQSILIKIGNFPAINFIERKTDSEITVRQPLENVIEKIVKETVQAIPNSDLIFTDSQYRIYESLSNSNHFSFSGPTSLGKSFIIETFIKSLIDKNLGINVAILVPTRALINQVAMKLSKELNNTNYKVLTHPSVPFMLKESDYSFIFVFTPERLISYLTEISNPRLDYLFIDEAQKIIADRDSRSPLYYHAIVQAEKKSVKLFFSSPNISNSAVFLELFDKSTEESITINESPVAQNRFFIDLIEKRAVYFSEFHGDINLTDFNFDNTDFNYWLRKLGKDAKNIIYCNTIEDTISFALNFSQTLPSKRSEKLFDLINEIKSSIHNDYYLIDCLEKGVAYHFGRLPQNIRIQIEELYLDKTIDYLFCTSTLLEGVNLPAKNIFILSNAIGTSKFSQIDFWNLAGRAGRLTQELSGNIICIRTVDKVNRWNNPKEDLNIIRNKKIENVQPILVSGKSNFYKNLEKSLNNEDFTRKNASFEQKNIWNHYSNIALIHHIKNDETKLKNSLIKKHPSTIERLNTIKKENDVPEKILIVSSSIKQKYQNRIWNKKNLVLSILPDDVNYLTCLAALRELYDLYNWEEEESGGTKPLVRNKEGLRYLALIMSDWMNGKPLKLMILNKLKFHEEGGYFIKNNQEVIFDRNDRSHINFLINNLISDIETKLRFTLRNYFLNFNQILKEKFGPEHSGANWADFLEYGTADYRIIELQMFGLSRQTSNYLIDKHLECLMFRSNTLVGINTKRLLRVIDKNSNEYEEIHNSLLNLEEDID